MKRLKVFFFIIFFLSIYLITTNTTPKCHKFTIFKNKKYLENILKTEINATTLCEIICTSVILKYFSSRRCKWCQTDLFIYFFVISSCDYRTVKPNKFALIANFNVSEKFQSCFFFIRPQHAFFASKKSFI